MRASLTIDQLVDRYLARLRGEVGVSVHTAAAYGDDLARFARFAAGSFGVTDATRISRELVLAFQAAEAGRGIGARTQARRLSALRGLCRFAVSEGLFPESPLSDLRQPRQPRRLPSTLGGAEVERLLAASDRGPTPLRDRAIFEMLYGAGVRVSEATGLTVEQFLARERAIRVRGKGDKERLVPDNVVIAFTDTHLVMKSKNLPNHPTALFPGRRTNPNSIQEFDRTYYLPLEPVRNPKAIAMDKKNSNRALPMGSIGFATNGVAFFNPFDMGNEEAVNIMDRCCGHPAPNNQYHYHKYPVCVKTPFTDNGEGHSALIGFALDGFPLYGPYVAKGLMARDDTANPLDDFNMRHDEERGWHYHVTPGKYPYIIGGFAGTPDPRNLRRGPPKK